MKGYAIVNLDFAGDGVYIDLHLLPARNARATELQLMIPRAKRLSLSLSVCICLWNEHGSESKEGTKGTRESS